MNSLDNSSTIIQQHVATSNDVTFVITAAITIYTISLLFEKWVIAPLCKYIEMEKKIAIRKFKENLWYFCYYTILFTCGLILLHDKPWFPYHTELYMVKDNQKDWIIYPAMRYYYLVQTAFYLQGFVSLVFFETRRSDFLEYCLHHFFTIVLLVFSFLGEQHRIGTLVLLLHDTSDIFLSGTKCLHGIKKYSNVRSKKWCDYFGYPGFLLFASSFFFLRLYYYPRWIIYGITVEPARMAFSSAHWYFKYVKELRSVPVSVDLDGMCLYGRCLSTQYFLIGFMTALFCLHVFWGFLILKMIVGFVVNKKLDKDIRSDSGEEESVNYDKISPKQIDDTTKRTPEYEKKRRPYTNVREN